MPCSMPMPSWASQNVAMYRTVIVQMQMCCVTYSQKMLKSEFLKYRINSITGSTVLSRDVTFNAEKKSLDIREVSLFMRWWTTNFPSFQYTILLGP